MMPELKACFTSLTSETVSAQSLNLRPNIQTVVVTGRGGGKALRNWADTVSEVKEVKHAFNSGIMAREGVDY